MGPNDTSKVSGLSNVEICSLTGIVRAPNVASSNLTVVITSDTTDNPFLFDHIQYEPDATVILDNVTILVDAGDAKILYSSGWTEASESGIGFQTSIPNSFLTFDFVGAFRL